MRTSQRQRAGHGRVVGSVVSALASTALAASALAGLPVGTASAATGVAITPDADSTLVDQVTPLAGSTSTLVYSSYTRATATRGKPNAVGNPIDGRILARSAGGEVVDLGPVPQAKGPADVRDDDWSVVGNSVAAQRFVYAEEQPPRLLGIVDWWNSTTREHGSYTLPSGDFFVGAGPGGFIYRTSSDLLRLRLQSGPVSTLGRPFATGGVWSVVTGENGLVATGSEGRAVFMDFAHPGVFRPLDTGTTHNVYCRSVDSAYAGCNELDGGGIEDPVTATSVILVPLDGSAATTSTQCPGFAAVAAGAVIWNGQCQEHNNREVYGIADGDSTTATAAHSIEGPLVSAFGKAVGATPAGNFPVSGDWPNQEKSLVGFTSPKDVSTVVAATPSPVTAGAFALSPGAIAYTDDEPGSDPHAQVAAMVRTYHATPSSLTTRGAQRAGGGSGDAAVPPDVVAASGWTMVYADHEAPDPASGLSTMTLNVSTSYGTAHIPDQPRLNDRVSLSGNRMLIHTGGPAIPTLALYDVRTGTTSNLQDLGVPTNPPDSTIWGNGVVWSTQHNAVWRLDLRTGKVTNLRAAQRNPSAFGVTTVYAYGNWVGWWQSGHSTPNSDDVSQMRNIATMAPATTLKRGLAGLTSGGALLHHFRYVEAPGNVGEWTYYLRSYQGDVRQLLAESGYQSDPQLVGNALAWIGPKGVLRAKSVKVPVARPRSLGDSAAPTSFAAAAGTEWTLATPYSLGLTSCTVTLARAGKTVTTLTCATSSQRRGVAIVQWNGTTSTGADAPAGTYTWSIHASGVSGAARNSAGHVTPVTGTVTLTR